MRLKEAVLAAGITVGSGGLESSCRSDELDIREIKKTEQLAVQSGDWRLTAVATTEVSVSESPEPTFCNWALGLLKKDTAFSSMAAEDQETFVVGFIDLARALNKDLNLDDFSSLKEETLIVPVKILDELRTEKVFSVSEGGYGRLQALAIADGFPVDHPELQQENFNRALASGKKMTTSPWYYVDREGSEDSEMVLAPDVKERLENFGQAFSQQSFGGQTGWRITVTDIMRSPETQAKRNDLRGSTHTTGRSFDISNGRFLNPEGKYVTYSAFGADGKPTGQQSAHAPMIKNEMRPAIEQMLGQYGLVPFKESSHWHIYAPKDRVIDLSEELTVAVEIKKTEPSDAEKELSVWKRIKKIFDDDEELVVEEPERESGRPEIVDRFERVFNDDYSRSQAERLTTVEVDSRLEELRPMIEATFAEAFPNRKIQNPFLTILGYPNFSPDDRAAFGSLSFEGLSAKTVAWRNSDKESERKKWRAVSQAWVKDKIIELIKRMSPEDIQRLGILQGSTIHAGSRPAFYDLKGIWHWKRENKTEEEAIRYVDAVLRLPLENLDHSVDILEWRTKQQAAIDLLQRHSDKFGFNQEVMKYLTPEVMLAVMHAEFFSELDGRSFVEMSPAIFEPYNITFGPAVNDDLCSSGPVQLIESTFVGFLDNNFEDFRSIQTAEGETARFIVPTKVGEKKEGGRQVGVYDPDSFAQAMVGNPDSVLFYAAFSVADHTRGAFRVLFANEKFRKIWDQASNEDRELFLGSFAPLAINGGGRTAKKAAESLLADKELGTLRAMAEDLPTHTRKRNAKRGAERGFETMSYFMERAKRE